MVKLATRIKSVSSFFLQYITCSSLDARFCFCFLLEYEFIFIPSGVTASSPISSAFGAPFSVDLLSWRLALSPRNLFLASFGDLVLYKLRLIDAIAHALLNIILSTA